MLFVNNLYKIKELQNKDNTNISAVLELDENHPIFAGHFPNQPVLPGVCMVQAVSDVLEIALKQSYLLFSATNIKFTSIVNPLQNKRLTMQILIQKSEDAQLRLDVSASRDEENCLKMKAVYQLKAANANS